MGDPPNLDIILLSQAENMKYLKIHLVRRLIRKGYQKIENEDYILIRQQL